MTFYLLGLDLMYPKTGTISIACGAGRREQLVGLSHSVRRAGQWKDDLSSAVVELRLPGARQRPLLSSNLDPDTEFMRLWLLFQDSFRAVSQHSIMPDGRDKSSSVKSYISIYYRNSETFPVVPSSSLRTRLLGRETSSVPIFLDSSPHFRQVI